MYFYIVTFLVLMYMCYICLNKTYNYWSDRGINGPKPFPFVGNLNRILFGKEHFQDLLQRAYKDFPNENYIGIYRGLTPVLIIKDPEMIKQVLIKDFNKFPDRKLEVLYPFNENLVMVKGDTWSIVRSIFTSALTLGKVKNYVPVLEKCAVKLSKCIPGMMESGSVHDIQHLFGSFLMDAAGFNLFGIDFNVYSEDKRRLHNFIEAFIYQSVTSRIIVNLDFIVPGVQKIASLLKIDGRINIIKRCVLPFVNKVLKDKNRQKASLIDLIIKLKKQKFIEKVLDGQTIRIDSTDNLILSQVIIMLTGHVDNPAKLTSMVMYELALHQNKQHRFYAEINQHFKNNNDRITYESLNEMVYLDMVIKESLRKYIATGCERQVACDYEFPGTSLKIKKGTVVVIPMLAIQKDPKYFRDPNVFDPERFTAENKRNLPDCTFIPFGLGPRNCPGIRVSELLVKFSVASFLLRYKVETCEKTEKKFHYAPGLLKTKVIGGLWLKISQRSVSE